MTEAPPGQVAHVAVFDANQHHRAQVATALLALYQTSEFPDADAAIPVLRAAPPDLLLIDEHIPPRGGFALISALRNEHRFSATPIILTTTSEDAALATTARACGADALLHKPFRYSALVATIAALRNAATERAWLGLPATPRIALQSTLRVVNALADAVGNGEPPPFSDIEAACRPLVEAIHHNEFRTLLNAVRQHDDYTYTHSLRVGAMLALLGQAAGLDGDDLLLLTTGGLLHDTGKRAVPHCVLNKPGKLTAPESDIMRGHVTHSVRLLRAVPGIPPAILRIAEQHHEKLNGTGYPNGLAGAQIDDLTRMATIADVFSATTDKRAYHAGVPAERALHIMSTDMRDELDQPMLALFRAALLAAA